jgi:hypothetical protein
MEKREGFFAYASRPQQLTTTICDAVKLANQTGGCHFVTWEESDIAGKPLTAPIFEGLTNANVLIADITTTNFNVTFEIGYAIGIGRRVFLTKCSEYATNDELITRIGIFDTLGYETYSNSKDLARLISNIRDIHPINTAIAHNLSTPIYVLETPTRGNIMSHIISRIKKSRIFYRSFNPAESPRLSGPEAIIHTASSFGVVATSPRN